MHKILSIIIILFGIFTSSFIYAETNESNSGKVPEVVYPALELGGCKDKAECFAYCELPLNGKQCLAFAKEYQLLPEEEIRVAEKVLGVKGGPGGCNSKDSCETYCDDVANIETCLAFAEEHGLMKGKDLEEAKKVRTMIQNGKKLPGGCRNKNACKSYCENGEHIDECLAFAEESGFLPPEELEQARKFMPLMKKGETPGACKSKYECEAYCEADEHFDECISFAEKHGMIEEGEKEHIEAFKKAGGKGPGGCKGRQCQAFCEQPGNQEACFKWAKENGVLKEDDLRRIDEGRKQIEKVLGEAPPEVVSCLEEALGPGGLEKMRSGEFFGGEAVGEKMHTCFEGFMSKMGGDFDKGDHENSEQRGEREQRGDFSGPGGCKGPDECMNYCKNNPEECQKFSSPRELPEKGEFRERPEEFPAQKFPEQSESDRQEFPKDFNQERDRQYDQHYREEFKQQYDQQYQEQYQKERDQQYQQQYQQPYQEQRGEFRPPEGSDAPPVFDARPPEGGNNPPPSGEMFSQPESQRQP